MNMNKIKDYFLKYLWLSPILAGLVVRLYKMTYSSIWHDEGYTMWLIKYNFLEIVTRTARDVHPPAYYFFAKIWTLIFGSSVFGIRSLSLVFSLGVIYFAFKTVELVFSRRAAFWTAMIIALSPFMVRFAQEARMYGVVAFFTTIATYCLAKYIKEKNSKYLYFYAPAMVIAMYTQYYSFFVIIVHWLIITIFTEGFWKFNLKQAFKARPGVFAPGWWFANIFEFVAYLPWFPVAYKQVTRVSGSYWIKPEWITERTIPNNILQFGIYNHLDNIFTKGQIGGIAYWLLILFVVASGVILFKYFDRKRVLAVFIFAYLPMIMVFTLSKLRTPVYQDRYFPFSAVGIFAIWGASIAIMKNKKLATVMGGLVLLLLGYGNYRMHNDVDHNMWEATSVIKTQSQPGDLVISGELYTFLDGAYYLGDKNIKLLVEKNTDGYGESSLFYDQPETYEIAMDKVSEASRVWVLGKTGEKDYYKQEKWSSWNGVTYFEENKDNGLKVMLYSKEAIVYNTPSVD